MELFCVIHFLLEVFDGFFVFFLNWNDQVFYLGEVVTSLLQSRGKFCNGFIISSTFLLKLNDAAILVLDLTLMFGCKSGPNRNFIFKLGIVFVYLVNFH